MDNIEKDIRLVHLDHTRLDNCRKLAGLTQKQLVDSMAKTPILERVKLRKLQQILSTDSVVVFQY